ncbi:unnamed protein product [Phytophthora fragariaefolia]|uniref:Unnamed protein product n=1 Tax=Phytophthora fragariaefolia TaxID=1490495 RepID=A0A9W6YGX9_9STRA|nr:unnamed protein product [Phytophthora fragariaefolia]
MVPRPGSTPPEYDQGVTIKQEPEAGASLVDRSPTPSVHEEGPAASWSSEGTFTTGNGASDDQEGYEEQFAVPDVASPAEATQGFHSRRSRTGRTPAKAEDQQLPTARAAMKHKPKKKKKLRAPGSPGEPPSKPEGKNAGRQYTAKEMEYAMSRTELFRMLEHDPILCFLKPKLMSKLTGPILVPDMTSLTSVRRAALTLFEILRESGFVLGAFEMEKVYDWDLTSWTHTIQIILEPLTILVGVVKRASTPTQVGPASTPIQTSPPRYPSSVDSDSSVEPPKRMTMEHRPRVMLYSATPARVETPATQEGAIPKELEDAIVRLMQSTLMKSTASRPRATSSAPVPMATHVQTPPVRSTTTTVPQPEPVDVDMKSVSSHSTSRSKNRRDEEDPDDLFDLVDGTPGTAAAVSTATAGAGLTRVRLSASSELKEFYGRDSSEEKALAWLNRLKSAARRDAMTGEEVCAPFSDLMNGPARQWYLQLSKKVRKTWPDLMEQFRIQYCGKGISMASRYYHAAKHADETPLEYLYRLNVAGLRANIPYMDGTAEEKREHVELLINTLEHQEEELASRLTLMEVPDSVALEKKLRARQRGLAHQKKTLFGSGKFRQKAPMPTPQPTRAVHAIQLASDGYDSGRESRDSEGSLCEQDRDDEDRVKLFVAGQAPPGEPARRNFETGESGRDRPPRCRHCGSRRHADGDWWSLLTCQKCEGPHPTERCLRVCKACGDVHDAGECPYEEFFNQLRQWFDPDKHAGMLPPTAETMLN